MYIYIYICLLYKYIYISIYTGAPKSSKTKHSMYKEIKGSNREFIQFLMNKVPKIFEHHQLERVQRDVMKQMIPKLESGW